MPYVFEDLSGNDHHLIITTSADWTIHSADLPNGDNSASLVTALNQNAFWPGEDFTLPNSTGSTTRSLEFWLKVTANTTDRFIATSRTNGISTAAANRQYTVLLTSEEKILARWYSDSSSGYVLAKDSSVLSAGWHYIVVMFHCGDTKGFSIYVDTVNDTNHITDAGFGMTYDTHGTYEFYLGSSRTDSTGDITDHLAKVAWYNRALTGTEMSNHYLAMTAS